MRGKKARQKRRAKIKHRRKSKKRSLMVEKFPEKSKKVYIIVKLRHDLQLTENKTLTEGKNHVFQVGQPFKHPSLSIPYLGSIWPLSSQNKLLLKVYFPFSI